MEKTIESELTVFDPIVAGLELLREEAASLVVKDFNDKAGYDAVKKFRNQKVVKLKTAIENERKRVKQFYLDCGREIDGRAKDIQAQIQQVISYCESQEAIVDREIERVKFEKQEAIRKVRDERIAKLEAVKFSIGALDLAYIESAKPEDFDALLLKETTRFEREEKERIANEAEFKRLQNMEAELRAKREAEAKELAETQAALIKSQQEQLAQQEKEKLAIAAKEVEVARAKAKAEAEAKAQVADKALFDEIKRSFPTLESAWVEIARLRKQSK
jgi:hypothetical protein